MSDAVKVLIVIVIATWAAPWFAMVAYGARIADLFPGMIEQGLIPATIGFWQAAKLVVMVGLIGAGTRGSKS